MSAEANPEQEQDSWPIQKMSEGRYYYLEGEYIVFTALYHRSRATAAAPAAGTVHTDMRMSGSRIKRVRTSV